MSSYFSVFVKVLVNILTLQNQELLIASYEWELWKSVLLWNLSITLCVPLPGLSKDNFSQTPACCGFFHTLDCMGTLCNLCISLMLHGDSVIWKCSPRSGLQKYRCLLPRATCLTDFYLLRSRCLERKQCGGFVSNIIRKTLCSSIAVICKPPLSWWTRSLLLPTTINQLQP